MAMHVGIDASHLGGQTGIIRRHLRETREPTMETREFLRIA